MRFDVNVRGSRLDRVLEHRLKEFYDRGIFGPEGQASEIDDVAEILAQLLRERGDLVGAPVDPVDGLQQQRFGHDRDVDVLARQPRDFVEGKQVRRVDHRNQNRVVLLLEQKCPEAPRLGFGQLARHRGIEVVVLQVDERDAELAGERLADLVFRKIPAFDQHPPELPPRAALVLQGRLELLLRDELLLHQQIAEPYPLGTLGSDGLGHDLALPSPPTATSGCRRGQRYRVPGKGANAPSCPISPSWARAAWSSPLNREGRSLASCSRVGSHRRVC